MTAAAIATVLGGRKTLKRAIKTDHDLRLLTRSGIPVATLPPLAEKLGIERKTLAKVIGISERTLSRRLATNAKLTPHESDRAMRFASIMAHAIDVFGDAEKASRWLHTPNLVMERQTPLSLLDTESGAGWVDNVLGRIEWGIYS